MSSTEGTSQKKKATAPSSNQLWNIIDNMSTKIAITNDDAVLEKSIAQYLPQLLSLIGFPDTSIRNKVMEVLTHINKRVRQTDNIKLPFEKILELFMNATDEKNGAMTRNFSIIYLDMAFERLEKKGEIVPQLFEGISTKLVSQQDVLLRLILEALPSIKVPTYGEQNEEREKFMATFASFKVNKNDKLLLLDFLRDYMLFRANYKIAGDQLDIPAGLSIQAIHRIVGPIKEGKTPNANVKVYDKKLAIVDFVYNSQLFEDNEIYQILLIGSLDGQQAVTSKCENAIKKLTLDYTDKTFIDERKYLIKF
jgi:proteasome component ECM29